MKTIELLKDLTQTTYDSVEGYRKAAEAAEKPAFKKAFERRRDTRAQTLEQLNNALQANSEAPITSASVAGETHRMFLTITDTLTQGDDAIIARVEEGESYLATKFENALANESSLDASMRLTVRDAFRDIREGERFGAMLEKQYA
ncbi:MAG: PA2169 family four-helix-bundle protein [Erythrobacter sp.]|uniref:PA2169 family four-helix-bundle protein n=1 Tax=Erythrobacter sp. TaxID=1042 RepID=UPI0026200848|nr:PA2169 family four-helix-bundle protein [Erythrobacter sp.]MDJ0977242.1 PA2169 family four-helix-bundle protein [Erythrobacter sp.]